MTGSSTRIVPAKAGWRKRGGRPHPFFPELHILKDFKCCVLKLRILNELRAHFVEMRIPKRLGCFALAGITELGWKLDFNTEGTEFTEETSSDGKRKLSKCGRKLVEVDDVRSMGHGSTRTGLLYIYLLYFVVLIRTHCGDSNATYASREIGRA
jgi:hypothetical protein